MTRVVIADDQALVRSGFSMILRAAGVEVVFVAVGSEQAEDVVREAGGLPGRIVVDCTNPVAWHPLEGAIWAPPAAGSVAEALAAAFPTARLVKGFCTFSARFHRSARVAGRPVDVPLAGDDGENPEAAQTLRWSRSS